MALAKQLMGAGFSSGQASAIGGLYTTYAAAGSTQADATTIGAGLSIVTAADATKGVILSGQVGDSVEIFNNSGSTLKVYPDSGAAIAVPGTGLGTANASYAHTTYAVVWYTKITATQWLPTKSA
ncbi:MAG: hypothetical protein WC733_03465 [Methylophilus sp.]|jgi:hypothetical protein